MTSIRKEEYIKYWHYEDYYYEIEFFGMQDGKETYCRYFDKDDPLCIPKYFKTNDFVGWTVPYFKINKNIKSLI